MGPDLVPAGQWRTKTWHSGAKKHHGTTTLSKGLQQRQQAALDHRRRVNGPHRDRLRRASDRIQQGANKEHLVAPGSIESHPHGVCVFASAKPSAHQCRLAIADRRNDGHDPIMHGQGRNRPPRHCGRRQVRRSPLDCRLGGRRSKLRPPKSRVGLGRVLRHSEGARRRCFTLEVRPPGIAAATHHHRRVRKPTRQPCRK